MSATQPETTSGVFRRMRDFLGLRKSIIGMLSMVVGAILHQVSSLAVALNSMRLLLYRPDLDQTPRLKNSSES